MSKNIVSPLAKGRGGGRGSSGGIDDNWDAPPLIKALFAFQIIWTIVAVILLIYITKALSRIPSWSARGPFLMLVFVTLFTIAYYVTYAISVRVDILDNVVASQVSSAISFLAAVDEAFRPGVVLYLLHMRGDVLRAIKGGTITPVASQLWKKILDWTLVSLTFIFYVAMMGVRASWNERSNNFDLTEDEFWQFYEASKALGHVVIAFIILLCIDVFASIIIHFVQSKNAQASDPVATRLFAMAAPFFLIYALESLIIDIAVYTVDGYDPDSVNLADLIIAGACKMLILLALLVTMTLPNVPWTAPNTGASVAYPGAPMQQQQWSTPNSGWSQPLFNQQQPYYQPEQPANYHPGGYPAGNGTPANFQPANVTPANSTPTYFTPTNYQPGNNAPAGYHPGNYQPQPIVNQQH